MLDSAKGSRSALENVLGFEQLWIPGGKLPNGNNEAVIDVKAERGEKTPATETIEVHLGEE